MVNLGKIFSIVAAFTLLLATLTMFFVMLLGFFDHLTINDVRNESVPCIDDLGRPFENELCIKTIKCSKFGVVAEEKCALNVGGLDGN